MNENVLSTLRDRVQNIAARTTTIADTIDGGVPEVEMVAKEMRGGLLYYFDHIDVFCGFLEGELTRIENQILNTTKNSTSKILG